MECDKTKKGMDHVVDVSFSSRFYSFLPRWYS
jgi:hypothetical protein